MQCFRCLRAVAPRPVLSVPRAPISALQQLRSISILSAKRPQLLPAHASVPQPLSIAPATADAETADILPKVSSHPALAGIQVRNGPRDTYDPSNLVRKRRHGFLSRIRTKKGKKLLKRRKAKGRTTLSH
ncbi:uncharacterized protein K452DRAFT_271362 [Aplosporella prunicola CBS 121167]|uniref:Large ribosomal subunit protein bL34m n=1 Tax=Aplosporella prunicola CBS 121167 TaxID=1176127 RepID=A0A6A6BEG1_9PEZI|nr:uncharacterized protein K452DRAFT_271362 [Aplosporella prunicola CBS 121167]KAF2141695.1 hypothetical protein K452DRAFT_271362 [Aplosporella prunicola CBS 121167]